MKINDFINIFNFYLDNPQDTIELEPWDLEELIKYLEEYKQLKEAMEDDLK